ncbi:V-set and transmembrane domain-containing protein 5 [Gadus macrocephalus]|uniref:V-set and transmembrane domain-containing protein 5 n=1 Tax=Gadus macrocephalus TaxID=80720 RepID=UPI0028CB68B2|nr:V-set and transmembrane domain-containing protein 5 [Gadus macrocephalus]
MCNLRLLELQDIWLVLCITLYVIHIAGAISVASPQRSMTRSVQEDVLFSVRVTCQGVPTLQWTFMSGAVSRSIGSWRPDSSGVGGGGGGGSFSNITADYIDRVETYANGSLGLARLRLADAGFYVLTVTEGSGSSKDSGFVLKVNEVIYEDLQYLSVSALVLFCLAGLLMLSMWLLNRAYKKIKACRRRREQNGNETELQPL